MSELTFDDIYKLTSTVSGAAAFEEPECRAFFDVLMRLPEGATIVEVGIQYGRSTSIILQVGRERGFAIHLIDPYPHKEAPQFMRMALEVGCSFTLHVMKTADYPSLPAQVDLVHIDGDHSTACVELDCVYLLSRVVSGGYACFHDYGRDSLPDVLPAVDRFVRNELWVEDSHTGTLLVMRRR